MKTLPPLTDEERELAEKYHHLIDKFLRRKRLDPSEYYDVAVFGYLSAIQQECRSGDQYPEEKKNFLGLVEVCMRNAVYAEWASLKLEKSKANLLSVSFDAIRVPDTESSLYEILEDPGVNIEESVAARDLVERLLAEATPREREIAEYICLGYEPGEVAEKTGLPPSTIRQYLYNFRVRARATAGGQKEEYDRKLEEKKEKRRAYLESRKEEIKEQQRAYRAAHLEKIRAKERAYREAHRDEINARKRAKRAAKKEQARLEALAREADIKRASYSPVSLKPLGMKPEGDSVIISYPRDENKEVIVCLLAFVPWVWTHTVY